MQKKYFALKIFPLRPGFSQDMSENEKALMQAHVVYWKGLLDKGTLLVFGPVLDAATPYSLGIFAVTADTEMQKITADDPAAGLHTYESNQMLAVLADSL